MIKRDVMKRLAGAIGIVGGIAAVMWAMRDRLISVVGSREPEPPRFRSVPAANQLGVEAIDGIGPTYAKRLVAAGVTDVAGLAEASRDRVAEAAGVSAARARAWIEQAAEKT